MCVFWNKDSIFEICLYHTKDPWDIFITFLKYVYFIFEIKHFCFSHRSIKYVMAMVVVMLMATKEIVTVQSRSHIGLSQKDVSVGGKKAALCSIARYDVVGEGALRRGKTEKAKWREEKGRGRIKRGAWEAGSIGLVRSGLRVGQSWR